MSKSTKGQKERWELRLVFTTPAFLGDAFQRGEWRTPPIKAALRQWWRIAVAKECKYDHEQVRRREALLFGHAWFEEPEGVRPRRSRVELALGGWEEGTLKGWPPPGTSRRAPGERSDPLQYLGYGPVDKGKLKRPPALVAEAAADLLLRLPAEHRDEIRLALALLSHFGNLGGRSRNGWGSLRIEAIDLPPLRDVIGQHCLAVEDCLRRTWPHAVGKDAKGPLLWISGKAHASWQDAMEEIANVKRAYRGTVSRALRGLVAAPSKPAMVGWKDSDRWPNQIRHKVWKDGEQFRAITVHVPAKCPFPHREDEEKLWEGVHATLDGLVPRASTAT
jgi:CRISPR-associated protein Cmr1